MLVMYLHGKSDRVQITSIHLLHMSHLISEPTMANALRKVSVIQAMYILSRAQTCMYPDLYIPIMI